MHQVSKEYGKISARDLKKFRETLKMTDKDCHDYSALKQIGIGFDDAYLRDATRYYAMDDQQGLLTTASITTPVQFLQNWLPGNVHTITAARKIDEIVGISTSGSWEDEQIVQGVLEPIGNAIPYGDYTNIPLSDWNLNFNIRTVIRFEKGLKVGRLEEARAARMRINSAGEKRNSAGLALEIQRNLIGFYGYNNGNNQTYGYLNDPSLPAYVTVALGASGSTFWSNKTFLEITNDIRTSAAQLQNQSQDNINPEENEITLALATIDYQYLSVVSDFGISVRKWIEDTYRNMRIVSAPQLNGANGGANVFYMFAEHVEDGSTDDRRTFIQIVPSKFQALGVQPEAKGYIEDFANATAGIMLKRPWAVVRFSGI